MARIRAVAGASVVASDYIEVIDADEFLAFVAPAPVPHRPLQSQRGGLIGIGNVRLDHRTTVRQWSNSADTTASDLDLVLEAIANKGTQCIKDTLGDFAVVVWNAKSRTLTAARDAFGVKTLFIGRRGRLLVLSSHLELVHESETLDEEYVADFLLAGDPGPERTIWSDSRAVTQGSIITSRDGSCGSERFWDPYAFQPEHGVDEHSRIEQFHSLFAEAVRTRLEPDGSSWAELSGGLDSSSIVCMAQTLAKTGAARGVAGTISIVDELGAGDERRFSSLVVDRFGLPNTAIKNPWSWQDDGHAPPRTDEPRTHYPFFGRDRLVCDTVRSAGAKVLLSGTGADHYLYGSRLFIPDLIATGHPARALNELARWSVLEKRSFWSSLSRDGVIPLLPTAAQLPFQESWLRVPDWIEPSFARRLGMTHRLPAPRMGHAPRGRMFSWQIASAMQELVRWLPRGTFEDGIELRYPFLYRPLVELGLQLPPSMRAQPLAPKWILRQAMRHIVPEPIRTRSGKGAIDARLIWALRHEQSRLSAIMADSALAGLGAVRPKQLTTAIARAARGELPSIIMLLAALSLETWLFVRAGKWMDGQSGSSSMLKAVRIKKVQPV